ncbi:mechanosensitive ion channel family protein [Cellulosilyticum ruminicola]|uniref:mechanosensitive ion channel family protein n=1 Tax=Cellulosilyticum ruminicola TaxID=425254 RepID=UPI0006D165F6|nr:mechanosensitive ion channel family protein [Cellulosilyticum ruminicola]
MNEFLVIKDFLYNFSRNSLYLRLTASLVLLISSLISHRLFSRLMIKLVSRIEIKHTRIDLNHLDALQKPFNHLFVLTGIYFSIAVSPLVIYNGVTTESFWFVQIPISIIPFKVLNKFFFSLVSAYMTWIIYLIAHIYEELLNYLNIKLPFMDNSLFLRFTARIIRAGIIIIGVFISLSFLFEGLPSILTGVGLGGAALAFVAKDALSNVFSGMILMFDKPFVIGDWIEIISLEGVVEDISFRSTRLRTFTQGQVVIPNAQISSANLINWTRMEKRRVKFDLGVSYNTSINDLNTCIKKSKRFY